jgi:hypothetical protein
MTLVYLASKKGIEMTKHTKERSKRYVCMAGLYPSWMFATWTREARQTIGEIVSVIKEGAMVHMSEEARRKSSVPHVSKGRSWSSGSVNARPSRKSVTGVWGVPEVPEGVVVKEPTPWKAAIPQY